MPKNIGKPPKAERVDIRMANGWVVRGIDPKKYRWELPPHCPGVHIEEWQIAKG